MVGRRGKGGGTSQLKVIKFKRIKHRTINFDVINKVWLLTMLSMFVEKKGKIIVIIKK